MFIVNKLLPFELLPLPSATPSWLLIEELLIEVADRLHTVLQSLDFSFWVVLLPVNREGTFFLHMSSDNSI